MIKERSGVMPEVTTDIAEGLREADVIFCVSSAVDAIVEPDHLKPGALVCDVARPRNVSAEVKERRDDVLVIEGGIVRVPGDVDFNFDFGFPKGNSYACMAETMIFGFRREVCKLVTGQRTHSRASRGHSCSCQKARF